MNGFKDFVDKSYFLESLNEREFNNGVTKIYIFDSERFPDEFHYDESLWAYFTEEEREKVKDDSYFGEIKCVLCNSPLNFCGILNWGTEVIVKKDIDECLKLSGRWMKEMLE